MKQRPIWCLVAVFCLLSSVSSLIACQPAQQQTNSNSIDEQLVRIANRTDKNFELYKAMLDKIADLERRVGSLESLIKTYDIEIRTLNDKLSRVGAGSPNTTTPPPPVTTVTTPPLTTEEAVKETDNQLARLKDGLRAEDVAKALQQLGKHAAPKICESLKTAFRDVDYMKRLEFVLGKLPAADVKIPAEMALKNAVARYPVARAIGELGDRELAKLLEPFTSDPEADFVYTVGTSLLRCKNRAGVPALIRVLRTSDKDKNTRYLAASALTSMRVREKDADFGYDYNKLAAENAAAIARWEEWYEKAGPKLFD